MLMLEMFLENAVNDVKKDEKNGVTVQISQ